MTARDITDAVLVGKRPEATRKQAALLQAAILAAFATLVGFGIREVQISLELAIEAAEETHLSLYDASYLWLARSMKVELITLDARLEKAAKAAPD